MHHIPFRGIDKEMSSLRGLARVASLTETSAIAATTQRKKARKAGFIMIQFRWLTALDSLAVAGVQATE